MIGEMFSGFGLLIICGILFWMLYELCIRPNRRDNYYEDRLTMLEILTIDKIAKIRGYDLPKEMEKLRLRNSNKFRKKLEDEMVTEFFGKEKDEKK